MKAEVLELVESKEKSEGKREKIPKQEIKRSSDTVIFQAKPSWWNRIAPSQFKTLITGFATGTGATLAGIFNQVKTASIFGFASTVLFNVFIARDINQAREEAEKLQRQVNVEFQPTEEPEQDIEVNLNALEKFNLVKPTAYTAITVTLLSSAAAVVKLAPVFLSSEAVQREILKLRKAEDIIPPITAKSEESESDTENNQPSGKTAALN